MPNDEENTFFLLQQRTAKILTKDILEIQTATKIAYSHIVKMADIEQKIESAVSKLNTLMKRIGVERPVSKIAQSPASTLPIDPVVAHHFFDTNSKVLSFEFFRTILGAFQKILREEFQTETEVTEIVLASSKKLAVKPDLFLPIERNSRLAYVAPIWNEGFLQEILRETKEKDRFRGIEQIPGEVLSLLAAEILECSKESDVRPSCTASELRQMGEAISDYPIASACLRKQNFALWLCFY